jgi:transcriptional regulator NrdR family protein
LVEPFSADKLYTEILLALQDRKDCYSEARELTTTITQKVFKNAQKPLCEAQTISLAAADVLKRFDKRAYLRFTAEHPSLQA